MRFFIIGIFAGLMCLAFGFLFTFGVLIAIEKRGLNINLNGIICEPK